MKYHDESTNVSIVSVSRRAGPPHFGHLQCTNSASFASGLPLRVGRGVRDGLEGSLGEAWLASVTGWLRRTDGTLLPATYYSQLNCDDALDARDEKNFDTAWVEQSAAVERQWAAAEIEPGRVMRRQQQPLPAQNAAQELLVQVLCDAKPLSRPGKALAYHAITGRPPGSCRRWPAPAGRSTC